MAQHLADLRQRRAGAQHLRGRAMAQAMRADGPQASPSGGSAHDAADPNARQPTQRSLDTDEQRALLRAGRMAVMQVGRDRLADVGGQRQPIAAAALAADRDLPSAPADVIEQERGDLAGAYPESDEHRQDREVAAAAGGVAVA
jgi:hypothetical protein